MPFLRIVGSLFWQWGVRASGGISVLMFLVGHAFGWDGATVFRYTAYGALLFCSVLQGIKIWHLEQRLKPKFHVECDSNNVLCKTMELLIVHDGEGTSIPSGKAPYFRMIVSVKGVNAVQKCTAYVEQIWHGRNQWLHHKLQVPFIGDESEEYSKTISSGSPERIDLLHVIDSEARMRIRTAPAALDVSDLFSTSTEYLLKVVIVGADVSSLTVWLKFTREDEPEFSTLQITADRPSTP